MAIASTQDDRVQVDKLRSDRIKRLWPYTISALSIKGGGADEGVHEAVCPRTGRRAIVERLASCFSQARVGEDEVLLRAECWSSRDAVPGLRLSRSGARLLRAGLSGLSTVRARLESRVLRPVRKLGIWLSSTRLHPIRLLASRTGTDGINQNGAIDFA